MQKMQKKEKKEKKEKKNKNFFQVLKTLLSDVKGLKAKLIVLSIIPVLITNLIILIGIGYFVPNAVNSIKENEIYLQSDRLTQYLENLKNDGMRNSERIAMDPQLQDVMTKGEFVGVPTVLTVLSENMWRNTPEAAPDFVIVTDNGGKVLARLIYDIENKRYTRGDAGDNIVDNHEIKVALSGNFGSSYQKNDFSRMALHVAYSIRSLPQKDNQGEEDEEPLDGETEIIGAVSVGYKLDSNKYVDKLKEGKDIEVSVFDGDERVATTIMADGERKLGTKLNSHVWSELKKDPETHVENLNLFGKSSIAAYVPLFAGDGTLIGNIGVAVESANIAVFYILIVLLVLVTTGIFVFISLKRINNMIMKPITSLVNAANTLAEGDVNVNLSKMNSKDELEQLTDSFLKMSANIKEQAELLSKISSGDLSIEVTPKSADDLIGNSLKNLVDINNSVFAEIISSAEQVAAGSKQIADGSQALSQGTTEQASAIEQLSESISKIASQTRQNAENANQSNKFITEILSNAQQGKDQMDEMLYSVQDISKASAEISKVIKVIDDIAFQTNILALNAAVEAARAGNYGKGFAVVAEEVRNLAAKSAKAANETTLMIENSIKKAKEGEMIAKKTAESFDTIVDGVEKTTSIISEIAHASNEQATSIAQVNQGVEQVSKVVQTNAATAEESAAASEEMASQAIVLKDMISTKFTLKNIDQYKPQKPVSSGKAAKAEERIEINLDNQDFGKY